MFAGLQHMLEFKEDFSDGSEGMNLLEHEFKQAECNSFILPCLFICFQQKVCPNLGVSPSLRSGLKVCVFRPVVLDQMYVSIFSKVRVSRNLPITTNAKNFSQFCPPFLEFN